MKRALLLAACAAAAVSCNTSTTGTAAQVQANPAAAAAVGSELADSPNPLPVGDEMCENLLQYVDGLKQLDPDAEVGEALDAVLAESTSSADWKTMPKIEQDRMKAAFEQAKTGGC